MEDMTLYTQYIGALSLLGRLVKLRDLSMEDRDSVERAFADANKYLKAQKAHIKFSQTSSSGFAAFQEKPCNPSRMR